MRLLITADEGGSNGYRTRLCKTELAALAAQTGLAITVCHLPPGTSKWNKIEHRLFSRISINWRGRSLSRHEVIVNTIGATTTPRRTGDRGPRRQRVPGRDQDSRQADARPRDQPAPLARHDWHGEWNYTLNPTRSK